LMKLRPERQRYPSSLVTTSVKCSSSGKDDMLKAIQNMEWLQSFTWQPKTFGVSDFSDSLGLASILSKSTNLAYLRITSNDDPFIIDNHDLSGYEDHPLFHIANLKSLHLKGHFWTFWKRDSPLSSMLARSLDLQELTLSFGYDSPSFGSCFFPRLRKVMLHGEMRGVHLDEELDEEPVLKFLEAHPTIEELSWYPFNPHSFLSAGSLPALKEISSTHAFTMEILRDATVPNRAMESVAQISLGPRTMKDLAKIDGSKLRELYIWRYDQIQMVHQVAKLLPNVTVLSMPGFGIPRGETDETIDDYIYTLSCFTHLTTLLQTYVWPTVLAIRDQEARNLVISRFAQACPNLKHVAHWKFSTTSTVTLIRDGDSVTWIEED